MQDNVVSSAPSGQATPTRAIWGVFDRKERWSLSSRGWLMLACGLVLATVVFLQGVYPFLAVTHRVNSNVLVVEGWVHEYAIQAAVDEFRSGGYTRVFTTGGPVEGIGHYINDYNTSASVGAELLVKNGLARESVQMVPSRIMDRDRTFSSAVALHDWIRAHKPLVRGINVVTEDTHARRTWLLFQRALGKNVQVGIISVPNVDYRANGWWHYSEGVKGVVSEFAAYLYSKIFLFGAEPEQTEKTSQPIERNSSRK